MYFTHNSRNPNLCFHRIPEKSNIFREKHAKRMGGLQQIANIFLSSYVKHTQKINVYCKRSFSLTPCLRPGCRFWSLSAQDHIIEANVFLTKRTCHLPLDQALPSAATSRTKIKRASAALSLWLNNARSRGNASCEASRTLFSDHMSSACVTRTLHKYCWGAALVADCPT